MVVPTFNFAGYKVSPCVTAQVLRKFEIDEVEFMDGVSHPDVAVLRPKK
jgi:hypothetical protein